MRTACPMCKTVIEADRDDRPFRPFCSQRCKLADLDNWLKGVYRISTPIQPTDLDDEGEAIVTSAPPGPVTPGSDTVLRAMTDDGAFRVITTRTTETVRGAISAQGATGQTARMFGELLTGAILYRETMAPQLRVQGILRGSNGTGSLVADSHPSGRTRGLVQVEQGREIDLREGAVIQMMRTMPGGRINRGVVEVPTGGGISQAIMEYMQTSEQVVSMIAVTTVLDETGIA